jgi:23S rRNA (pseudouridine1915-N3)-methyltransferase
MARVKVELICIGKTGKSFLEEGEKEYLKRLKRYLKFDKIELPDVKMAKNTNEISIQQKEADLFFQKISDADFVILLDEKGKTFSSVKFSNYLQQLFNRGGHKIVFLVGGPYGFHESIYQRANAKISLSTMTFSHQMIRMLFLEQFYRAMTILKGEPYHHE